MLALVDVTATSATGGHILTRQFRAASLAEATARVVDWPHAEGVEAVQLSAVWSCHPVAVRGDAA
jgi:hypothetical protein